MSACLTPTTSRGTGSLREFFRFEFVGDLGRQTAICFWIPAFLKFFCNVLFDADDLAFDVKALTGFIGEDFANGAVEQAGGF